VEEIEIGLYRIIKRAIALARIRVYVIADAFRTFPKSRHSRARKRASRILCARGNYVIDSRSHSLTREEIRMNYYNSARCTMFGSLWFSLPPFRSAEIHLHKFATSARYNFSDGAHRESVSLADRTNAEHISISVVEMQMSSLSSLPHVRGAFCRRFRVPMLRQYARPIVRRGICYGRILSLLHLRGISVIYVALFPVHVVPYNPIQSAHEATSNIVSRRAAIYNFPRFESDRRKSKPCFSFCLKKSSAWEKEDDASLLSCGELMNFLSPFSRYSRNVPSNT